VRHISAQKAKGQSYGNSVQCIASWTAALYVGTGSPYVSS